MLLGNEIFVFAFGVLFRMYLYVCMQFQALEELQVTFPIFIMPHKAIP